MVGSLIIFGITYLAIATEKLDKTVAALLGAATCIILHIVPYEHALRSVDLNVVFLLVGMMLVVNVMAATGIFEWLAVTIAKRARGNGIAIFVTFLLSTAVLSAFLDNVTTVILVAPITVLVCEILEIKVAPILILEAIASNIGGTSTLVGDPPNVLIASKTGLTFVEFITNLMPPVVIMLVIGLPLAALVFRKSFTVPEANKARIMRARADLAILDRPGMYKSLAVFAVMLAAFFASHSIGVDPGIIALAGGLVMALVCKSDFHHLLEKVEWGSVFFFIGLFMLIGAMEYNGVFEALGHTITEATHGNFLLTVMVILWASALASAIVDNIPLVIAMIPLIQIIIPSFAQEMGLSNDPEALRLHVAEPLYWALALGACLGGNGTLVGASANVVVSQIGRRNGYDLSFMAFTRLGLPTMLGSLVIASGWLYFKYFM